MRANCGCLPQFVADAGMMSGAFAAPSPAALGQGSKARKAGWTLPVGSLCRLIPYSLWGNLIFWASYLNWVP